MNRLTALLIAVAALVGLTIYAGPFYIIQEGEQVVITQFGELVGQDNTTGLKFKVPGIQTVTTYPNKVMSWDGEPQRIPTQENQFIWVDTTARWRIKDLKKFYESVTSQQRAYARLDEVIDPAVREVISNNPLLEAVRNSDIINSIVRDNEVTGDAEDLEGLKSLISTNRTYNKVTQGRRMISEKILNNVKGAILEQFGIELIDVLIRQIRYSDDLTESVYNRMITERKQIAEGYRSYGQGRKQELLGKLEREKRAILSAAYNQAETIKGKADALAADLYATAYRQDPEFYNFWKAIESYKTTMPAFNKTLSTNMDYFKYLYSPKGR